MACVELPQLVRHQVLLRFSSHAIEPSSAPSYGCGPLLIFPYVETLLARARGCPWQGGREHGKRVKLSPVTPFVFAITSEMVWSTAKRGKDGSEQGSARSGAACWDVGCAPCCPATTACRPSGERRCSHHLASWALLPSHSPPFQNSTGIAPEQVVAHF